MYNKYNCIYNLYIECFQKACETDPLYTVTNRQKLKLLFENFFCNNPTSLESCFFVVFESKRSFGNFRKHCFCKQSYFGNVFLQIERKCLKVVKSCGWMFANFFSTKQHVSLRNNYAYITNVNITLNFLYGFSAKLLFETSWNFVKLFCLQKVVF